MGTPEPALFPGFEGLEPGKQWGQLFLEEAAVLFYNISTVAYRELTPKTGPLLKRLRLQRGRFAFRRRDCLTRRYAP